MSSKDDHEGASRTPHQSLPQPTTGAPAAEGRVFSPRELAFLIGVPAAWAILLLFHPTGDADGFYEVIDGNVTAWLTVHIGMGIFVPLFAGVVYLLLRGVHGTAATISRVGLAVFAVLYAAWELLLGAGTGILTDEVDALPETQQAVGRDLVESYGWASLVLMLLSLPLIAVHEPPFGPVGLALFIGAVLLFARQQASLPERSAAPPSQPVPAGHA